LIPARTFRAGIFYVLCLIAITEFAVNTQPLLNNEKLSASRLLISYDFFYLSGEDFLWLKRLTVEARNLLFFA
jgi:hypothetical protein